MASKTTKTSPEWLKVAGTASVDGTGGAGTAATVRIESSVSLSEKVGMRIWRTQWNISTLQTVMDADADEVNFGLSFLAAQPAGGFVSNSPGVIEWNGVITRVIGAGILNETVRMPVQNDYPAGLLVHPANLYHWNYVPNALVAAGPYTIWWTIFYTTEDINQDQWDDMWKAMFVAQAG